MQRSNFRSEGSRTEAALTSDSLQLAVSNERYVANSAVKRAGEILPRPAMLHLHGQNIHLKISALTMLCTEAIIISVVD